MRLGRSRSRWMLLAALGALLSAFPSAGARAEDEEAPLPGQVRAIKIGQSVLIVDEAGNAMMYEDPTVEAPACGDLEACWGFTAAGPAAIVISGQGDVVQGVDAASGSVFEETTTPP
jgi:hypothetical protein